MFFMKQFTTSKLSCKNLNELDNAPSSFQKSSKSNYCFLLFYFSSNVFVKNIFRSFHKIYPAKIAKIPV